jgi:hypoxanthine phosphoribosyltransferase
MIVMDKTYYSWSEFDSDVLDLFKQIDDSGWIPDYIVGVKRGGLVPAIKLSHCFHRPMIMMSCQLRDNNNTEVRLYEVEEIPKDKNILIVDDICDSGATFRKIMVEFYVRGHKSVRTCSLFYNTKQPFVVDYSIRNLDRSKNKEWIVFPWEI